MKTIPIFYTPEQTAHGCESFSPSAGKPEKVVESWGGLCYQKGQHFPLETMYFKPLTMTQISLAHDPAYVRKVLRGERSNGFGNTNEEVARSLPFTTGSLANAALHVFKNGGVAVSPTSGFHHANYDQGGGFCTFNGLVIAAQMLRLKGARKVGILDCDMHYGDGTDQIIKQLDIAGSVRHWTFGAEQITKLTAQDWLEALPKIVSCFDDCDVLLYQAGADPHIDDPLGGVLTSAQMAQRDRIVFQICKKLEIPLVWNLAGGYQKPLRKVLDLHDATMTECVEVYLDEK